MSDEGITKYLQQTEVQPDVPAHVEPQPGPQVEPTVGTLRLSDAIRIGGAVEAAVQGRLVWTRTPRWSTGQQLRYWCRI